MKISLDLQKNLRALKKALQADDVKFREIKVGSEKGCLIFVADICDKAAIGELIMRPAAALKGKITEKTLQNAFLSPETETAETIKDAAEKIVGGNCALIVNGVEKILLFGLKKFDKRAIAEPPTSTVIKGPREGFVESLPVNVSLMRRKLSTPNLVFKYLT
ncbi:MAG: spore germination protein, partial [Clostridia bacterium]|nr:spore germination protein [Clostridia bacterium]